MKHKYLSVIGLTILLGVVSCGGSAPSSEGSSSFVPTSSVTSSSEESSSLTPTSSELPSIEPSSASTSSSQDKEIIEANPDGKFYNKTSTDEPESFLPIYNAKGYNDVPFINITDFEPILKVEEMGFVDFKVNGDSLIISSRDEPNCKIEFDASKNEIRSYNYSQYVGSKRTNNNIGRDYCLVNTMGAIKPSNKTKVVVEPQSPKTISLNDYHLKIVKYNNKFYAPLELVNNILNPNSLHNYVFNGRDYFRFYMPESHYSTSVLSYCYSSNGSFYYGYNTGNGNAGNNYKKIDPKSGEKYRYTNVDADGLILNTEAIVFNNQNQGKLYGVNEGKEEELVIDGRVNHFYLEEDKDIIHIYTKKVDQGSDMYPSKDFFDHHLYVNKAKTRYGENTRSNEVALYTYNLMCLSFDYYYGLKLDDNFNQFVSNLGLKDKLLSNDVHVYSEAMYQLLLQKIDDGHTSMHSLSSYEYPASYRMNQYSYKYPTTRSKAISERALLLYGKRYDKLGYGVGHRFVDYEGDMAYIFFDKFASDGMPSFFSSYIGGDSSYLVENDTCGFMANAMLEIEEYNKNPENTTKIKNVVVDITCNGGGAMAALPYVAGLMTSDPTLNVKDVLSGKVSEYHYDCNFDGDNKVKTFADKYNFYLLTSNASFSCGTSLPGMLKGTNVKIIGQRSAGGAAPVTYFSTGSGLAYQTSGSDIIVYKDAQGNYVSIENGVPVDYEIDEGIWYDLPALRNKINTFIN